MKQLTAGKESLVARFDAYRREENLQQEETRSHTTVTGLGLATPSWPDWRRVYLGTNRAQAAALPRQERGRGWAPAGSLDIPLTYLGALGNARL